MHRRAKDEHSPPKDEIYFWQRGRAERTPIIIVNGTGVLSSLSGPSTMQICLLEFSVSLLPACSVALSPGEMCVKFFKTMIAARGKMISEVLRT